MARVYFEPTDRTLEVEPEERVLDAADEMQTAPFAVGCRDANCGTCLVRVVAGASWLAPPAPPERALLSRLGAAPDRRLGCQIRIAPSGARGIIRLRVSR